MGAHQRNGDKRQVVVVQAQTIEKPLVIGDARQHQRLALRQHGTDQSFPRPVANLRTAGQRLVFRLLQRFDAQDLLLAVVQANHPVLHKRIVM